MNDVQRTDVLRLRKVMRHPWHSPPHRSVPDSRYHISAACYEHQHIIGKSPERMLMFEECLLGVMQETGQELHAWAVLPNHYHVLVTSPDVLALLKALGTFHGRLSFQWNGEDQFRGRKVWCNALETGIKSDAHFWATMNYIHNNPVHHGYVVHWQEWVFGSAAGYWEKVGREIAVRYWQDFPVREMGKGWDASDC